jgi:predicted RNase H-like nuclease (RuvC/YqgF family)
MHRQILRELRDEKEKYTRASTSAEEVSAQLEACKRDLIEAERQRAEAIAQTTEVDALKKQLSDKEEEVRDLTAELFQKERELLRLKDRPKAGSACAGLPSDISSKSDILAHGPVLLRTNAKATQPAKASQSGEVVQGDFLVVRPPTSQCQQSMTA